MKSLVWFVVAAVGELAGCYAFWLWLRLQRSPAVLAWGLPALLVFAFALTRIDTNSASRAYAAYSAIYLVGALAWMRVIERQTPDRWDVTGAGVCLIGAAIILFGPRGA